MQVHPIRSDTNYKGRLVSYSLLPLSLRREMLDIFLFKCRQGLLCKTETFANSFFHHVVPSWNALAVELRLCTFLSTFKRLFKTHYTTIHFLMRNLTHRTLVPGLQNAAAQTVDLNLVLYFDCNYKGIYCFFFYFIWRPYLKVVSTCSASPQHCNLLEAK